MFDIKEVEKYYPGAGCLMIPPQLIHKGTDSQLKACEDGTWFAQLKKDGALYMYVKGVGGENYLFGRTVSKKTGLLTEKSANVPHIINAFKNIPNGSIILGEIYYPDKTSKDVTSIMGCLAPKAIERQKGSYGPIHYYIYDCLGYNGTSLLKYDNWTRYKVMQVIYNKVIEKDDTIELAAAVDTEIYATIGQALAAGEEGNIHSIGTIASGLTDFMREDMSLHPEKYLDRVVEIQCMMKDNKEKTLRHGFFLRIREDKDPVDCKIKNIFS